MANSMPATPKATPPTTAMLSMKLGLEEAVATNVILIDIRVSPTTLNLSSNTTAVRQLTIRENVAPFTGPVRRILNTTAMKLLLHDVPSVGDPTKLWAFLVVGHSRVHVLHHLGVEITFQHVSSNASTDLSNKDDREEEGVGVDQTFALLPRATAAHESHHKDHAADDHQEDWCVHIVVPQEVQVILGIN